VDDHASAKRLRPRWLPNVGEFHGRCEQNRQWPWAGSPERRLEAGRAVLAPVEVETL
jgi:hypothetical protein